MHNITIKGIQTNNLKNIDVSIKKNALNLILGPSGSGKSSLAYDTIAKIGLQEYLSMFYDEIGRRNCMFFKKESTIKWVCMNCHIMKETKGEMPQVIRCKCECPEHNSLSMHNWIKVRG